MKGTGGLHLRPARAAGLVLGLALFALALEGILRWRAPAAVGRAVIEQRFGPRNPMHPAAGDFRLDPEIGFVPVPGRSYDRHGVLHGDHALEKPPGTTRVLFLGDSVAARGDLVAALRAEWGDEGYEWWNAGVPGYSTAQEVGYWRDHLDVREDRLVLLFHLTDFEVTPVITLDEKGDMVVLNSRLAGWMPWLAKRSYLYRYWLGRRMGAGDPARTDASVAEEIERSLAELAREAARRGVALEVVVLPPLLPPESWPWSLHERHGLILSILRRLGIRHHPLRDVLERAVADGVELGSPPGDRMHPSAELSARFAARLRERGFLRPSRAAGGGR